MLQLCSYSTEAVCGCQSTTLWGELTAQSTRLTAHSYIANKLFCDIAVGCVLCAVGCALDLSTIETNPPEFLLCRLNHFSQVVVSHGNSDDGAGFRSTTGAG